ncbi:30S ribosomal protein S20 [Candidatus Hydrogenedentota bacterium]
MPQHKSCKKRVVTNEISRKRNAAIRSTIKTATKAFEEAAATGDSEKVVALAKEAVKQVDKAVSKGVLNKKNASHKKSALMRRANAISA